MTDDTPAYLAYCPACHGIVACSVADPADPLGETRARAYRTEWIEQGLRVETQAVRDISARTFGHHGACRRRVAQAPLFDASPRETR